MPEGIIRYLLYGGAAVAALVLLKIFSLPIRLIFKLIINTLLGFVGLIVFNYFGGYIGVTLGINWLNSLMIGFFGFPGLILLLLLRWLTM